MMKNFTDQFADIIIANEIPRIDKIMNEVTQKISIDFTNKMYELIDKYYDNYEPIRYVRVYGKRGNNVMKILLLRQDIELLTKAGIFHDENKEYSDDEALDLLEAVRDLEISYSQFERGHEFDL